MIMPMLSDVDLEPLLAVSEPYKIETADISIGVKEMFMEGGNLLTACRRISSEKWNCLLFGDRDDYAIILNQDAEQVLHLEDLIVYAFKTGVIFACAALTYTRMEMMSGICHPGYAKGNCKYYFQKDGQELPLEQTIEEALERLGLHSFYGPGSLFLEAFVYNAALMPSYFHTLEEIRKITFNMHRMSPMEQLVEDLSEEDVAYVYAVKIRSLDAYRWGCCVSSQTISYVKADPNLDYPKELQAQIRSGLPVVVLALYEKYTCLLFGRQLSKDNEKKSRHIRELKRRMLEFKAYGTVSPATISRWYNVRMIYAHLLRFFDVEEAIGEITDKIEILSNAQKEIEDARNNALMTGITIFGIVSILDSLLSIYEVIVNGTVGEWTILRTSVAVLALLVLGLFLVIRRRK